MSYKTFAQFAKLAAADVNDYLMKQSVMNFTSASDRTTQLTGVTLVEGMVSYLADINQLQIYNGTTWVVVADLDIWEPWTPTTTGLTLGNGTINAYYLQLGKTVWFQITFTLGSTSAISSPTFTLPVTPATTLPSRSTLGTVMCFDSSATDTFAGIIQLLSGTIRPLVSASATNTRVTIPSATVPFGVAWASGDILSIQGTYETV